MKKLLKSTTAAIAFAAALATAPVMAEQGVTDTEIVLGGHHDLSGPFAAFSVPAVKAINHYFAEVNAKGGVHGRMLKYVVEDHGYNVSKVGPAVNKLVNKDKIFAMLMALGTPHNLAAFKIMDPKGIPNVQPLSASASMLNEPLNSHFAGLSSYTNAIKTAVEYSSGFMKMKQGTGVVCSMYLPTDFGKDVQAGAKQGAEAAGLKYAAETTHKGDDGDFVGSLSKLKAAGCNIVATALGVRQTLTVLGTAKKMGLADMKFLGSSASFHTVVAKAGEGKIAEGFYAAAGWQDIEARAIDPVVGGWIKSFSESAGAKMMGSGAMLGRSGAELMVRALEAAGKDLTHASFIAAMETLNYDDVILGNHVKMGPGDHQGATEVFISQVQGASWKLLATINE